MVCTVGGDPTWFAASTLKDTTFSLNDRAEIAAAK
jgi:hypothetical protein